MDERERGEGDECSKYRARKQRVRAMNFKIFRKEKIEALALSEGLRKKILTKQQMRWKLKVIEPVTELHNMEIRSGICDLPEIRITLTMSVFANLVTYTVLHMEQNKSY